MALRLAIETPPKHHKAGITARIPHRKHRLPPSIEKENRPVCRCATRKCCHSSRSCIFDRNETMIQSRGPCRKCRCADHACSRSGLLPTCRCRPHRQKNRKDASTADREVPGAVPEKYHSPLDSQGSLFLPCYCLERVFRQWRDRNHPGKIPA